ncbi:MAG: DUF805 domain-containing protein [Burkholderiales bacterium]|jgi:uncharacterized membrane protein YhaH (DUF805 family)|uniref:DUF805 domain-containing protein n=1 Tax=Limnobacter sp. TaxID=2003368 RepID=UPI0039BCC13E|nr:DUF805 domain-containing protein [Burkholderiales bacterium]
MTFIESIETCFKKYAEFNGRATRSEFWWWVLFAVLITTAAQVLGEIPGTIVSLAILLPYIAVTARRLHDIGKSGWWQLVGIIPLIGWLIVIYWCAQNSSSDSTYN